MNSVLKPLVYKADRSAWEREKGSQERHHCHLKKGKPTYVAVWKVINQPEKSVEIEYVGTLEKSPY